MTAHRSEITDRLDQVEAALRRLDAELVELRRLAAADDEPVTAAPVELVRPLPTVASAWRALERGQGERSLEDALAALQRAVAEEDETAVDALRDFALAASRLVPPALSASANELVRRVRAAAVPPPEPPAAPAAPPVAQPAETPAPAPAAGPSRLRAWAERELTGSRLFALAGGTLMLLGIVFLFVVAARRGWVGPGERVAVGAAASLAVLAAGIVLRRRYGRLQASLAAVGVGIAGAYATLAAATLLYGFLPSWGALLVAAGIASVGGTVALSWSSQLLAGLALVGAAVAPAAVALDDGITAPAPAFALVVLAATVAAAASRRWQWLFVAVGVAALAQVVWLVAASPAEDGGALAVAAAAVLLLLAAGAAWQATATAPGLDPTAGTVVLLGAGLALAATRVLLPANRDAGIALAAAAAAYGLAALPAGRRWRDLGWVIGASALLLAAVATADLLSGRSLTIVLALEAALLMVLAWRLRGLRFELGALLYLALGTAHVGLVELDGAAAFGDVYRSAVPGLFALAGAAVASALLLPADRGDAASEGIAKALEPLWDGLQRNRPGIRAFLAAAAVVFAAAGSAGLLSGRLLTIAWAAASAALALGAYAAGERRLLTVAIPVLVLALVHAWQVEAPVSTLTLERTEAPLPPVPSLLALAAACVALAACCRFPQRGLRVLGPLAGPERALAAFDDEVSLGLRSILLHAAAALGVWAAGLGLIEISYGWGHVGATSLWAGLALVLVVRNGAGRIPPEVAGWVVLAFAFGKSAFFDWGVVGATAAAVSLLVVSATLLSAGFASRWLKRAGARGLEFGSIAAAALAAYAAVVAVDSLVDGSDRVFGASVLAVAAVLAGAAVPPFRARDALEWARTLATGYWVVSLLALMFAEAALTGYGATRICTLWAATATALALGWRRLDEPRLWLAAVALGLVTLAVVVAAVTPPGRLVEASSHPGAGISALLVCVVAALAVAWKPASLGGDWRDSSAAAAAGVGVYFVSLAVLELAERVSGASVETDFQRGHTVLSTLLGLGALGVYVLGLTRAHRPLRLAGLTLFGLALAKLFLYDLSSLSSITRALSFLALGAVLLAAAFFAERAVRGEHPHSGGRAGPTAGVA